MKQYKTAIGLVTEFIFSIISSLKVYAFQLASHCSLIEKVTVSLPEQSLIKKSLEAYLGIANGGSIALDLGYLQLGQVLDRAPWDDRYHYYKVGTFSQNN